MSEVSPLAGSAKYHLSIHPKPLLHGSVGYGERWSIRTVEMRLHDLPCYFLLIVHLDKA